MSQKDFFFASTYLSNLIWNFLVVPNVSFHVYAPSFLQRFIESHAVMFQGNAGLKPKEGEVTSRPWQWPINYKGQYFSGSSYRIYLLGNPIIWWSNLVFLALFLVVYFLSALKRQRGYDSNEDTAFKGQSNFSFELNWNTFEFFSVVEYKWRQLHAGSWLFAGWVGSNLIQ